MPGDGGCSWSFSVISQTFFEPFPGPIGRTEVAMWDNARHGTNVFTTLIPCPAVALYPEGPPAIVGQGDVGPFTGAVQEQ